MFVGYQPGMYLQYTFTSATIAPANAAGANIFQITSLKGLNYFNQSCNYQTAGVTPLTCAPSNCQLATCNVRNILEEFGSDYCTLSYYTALTGNPAPVGQTVAGTVGCGIQVLGTGYPTLGPQYPDNNPEMSTGAYVCPDNTNALAGLPGTSTVYITAALLLGGQQVTVAAFTNSVASQFAAAIASSISSSANTSVNVSIIGVTSASVPGRRLLQNYVTLTYQVATTVASSTAVRTQMTYFAGTVAALALSSPATSLVVSLAELSQSPTITGVSSATVYVYSTSTTSSSNKKAIQLGVGIGVGVGGALILGLVAAYFLHFKKKNIETGQKSAVTLAPMGAASA